MATPPALLHVTFPKGIYLPEVDLWLDPHVPKPWSFVSHAHADHVARHECFLASKDTFYIMKTRYGMAESTQCIALDYHEPYERQGWIYTLLPAGHILGSAMLHLKRVSDGATLLYTGDYKLRPSHTAQTPELMQADILILETTFGLSRYQFPPSSEVVQQVRGFIDGLHEDHAMPVLVAYSLGKAQEAIYSLKDGGYTFYTHRSMDAMNRIYRERYPDFPETHIYQNQGSLHSSAKPVLLVPPSVARSSAMKKLKRARFAMLSGWALDPGAHFRYQVDEAFPWSDHADYAELIETVERVQPRKVYTVHGFTREFASDLRARGYEAWSLVAEDQLDLGLDLAAPSAEPIPEPESPATLAPEPPMPTSFMAWCCVAESLQSEPSRLKKETLLKGFLKTLLTDDDLHRAILWFSGLTETSISELGPLNLGQMAIKRALMDISGLSLSQYQTIARSQNDLGRTSLIVLEPHLLRTFHNREVIPTLEEVEGFFQRIRDSKGSMLKIELLTEFLRKLHPLEASYVIRLVTGELRVGSREGVLEEAVAQAFEADSDQIREAAMLLGDLGQAAIEARHGRLDLVQPRPFVPIKVMLASPEPTAEAIWERLQPQPEPSDEEENHAVPLPKLDPEPVWLEDKFDGIRAQIHRSKGRVEIYTRDLKRITHQFPEIAAAAMLLKDDVIVDGEIIAFSEDRNKKLNFQDLQKRLGRRDQSDLFVPSAITVKYVIFDILWKNQTNLMKLPLHERRKALESTSLTPGIQRIAVWEANAPEEIEEAFQAARRASNEGLVAKDRHSRYQPGRRGKSWLKLKKAFSTLDVVVVKAEQGHGKRSHVLSDYTFAVRDELTQELKVIGKAYSGLTDVEIETLTEVFEADTLSQKGNVRTVQPRVILEIAFDAIQPSTRHNSGLALRFPRIKSIRHDKDVTEIDTLRYAQRLAGVLPQETAAVGAK